MSYKTIVPNWPAPERVIALATTRHGGLSSAPYDSLNLGRNSGDALENVRANREHLVTAGGLPGAPRWLSQVHGCDVVDASSATDEVQADASTTTCAGVVCVVLTADCLPVLFCDRKGSCVGAAHAGWRGLAAGILERTIDRLPVESTDLMAWLGPAIGPKVYEVGDEVRQAFVDQFGLATECFRPSPNNRWLADLYALARQRLSRAGINSIYGGDYCTYSDRNFFSYRRDGVTGRQASLIYLRA